MKKITIALRNEYREIFEDGSIIISLRDGVIIKSSKDWSVTGASVINNFGNIVCELSLSDLFETFETNKESLFYKNGKPKFKINDVDHGSSRTWSNKKRLKHHFNLI